ncbi:MAG TPA: thiamine-phosphate kinase, partial [Gemmatimonadales bacterium]|nr:thiamine-phosphate kinase [Gemmatimonadales bacterium]
LNGTCLAISTDVSVEQVHFRLDWIDLSDVGWRATAAALSDLAAEGAEPAGLLNALTIPSGATPSDLLQITTGIRDAARAAGAPVLGGDLSSGPAWSLAVTVLGFTDRPVTRAGAKPGDSLWVTGALGGTRAALEAWRRKDQPTQEARRRYARPLPRIDAGRWLAAHGARAMIDLSDGLGGDAAHIAAASGVALHINLDQVPVATEARDEARRSGTSPQRFAAESGEEFELLVALPPEFNQNDTFVRECALPLTLIGSVDRGSGLHVVSEGQPVHLTGFNHFG